MQMETHAFTLLGPAPSSTRSLSATRSIRNRAHLTENKAHPKTLSATKSACFRSSAPNSCLFIISSISNRQPFRPIRPSSVLSFCFQPLTSNLEPLAILIVNMIIRIHSNSFALITNSISNRQYSGRSSALSITLLPPCFQPLTSKLGPLRFSSRYTSRPEIPVIHSKQNHLVFLPETAPSVFSITDAQRLPLPSAPRVTSHGSQITVFSCPFSGRFIPTSDQKGPNLPLQSARNCHNIRHLRHSEHRYAVCNLTREGGVRGHCSARG
jgi:hypothetical protein